MTRTNKGGFILEMADIPMLIFGVDLREGEKLDYVTVLKIEETKCLLLQNDLNYESVLNKDILKIKV